ncbi:MAG: ferrous iron transport protein B, partial [Bacteroidales bacterium]
RILGYEVTLRRSEASLIEVITPNEAKNLGINQFNGTISGERFRETAQKKSNSIHVALVGNPNSGKTTLFNHASRSREHVGNYSGVTVVSKMAVFEQEGYSINMVDLPGTYSLSAYSPEELYVREYIFGEIPDVVVNIVDSSNLERNLYLSTQLIDMDIKVVIALNMYDELVKHGDQFDYQSLGKMIGIPIVPTISSKGYGIKELFQTVIDVYEDRDPTVRHVHINYGKSIERSIRIVQDEIQNIDELVNIISSRFYAIKLLEKDKPSYFTLSRWPAYEKIRECAEKEIMKLEQTFHYESDTLITDARYGFIAGALKETFTSSNSRRDVTGAIDAFMTNRLFGFPIFFIFMFIMFFTTFEVGQYPMDWLDRGVNFLSTWLKSAMPDGVLKDLLTEGIIGGVGSVIVFLPNILILFFFISLMEDSGYMARAAFIMDKVMHKIGLHGRSFIPLLMGFGCNVPAIMASRTIENRNNRLLTILINPFMSCSARLPVYILIIGAFFPNHPGLMLFAMYLTGIILAALVAVVFKKLIFKTEEIPFVMELPPYRIPTLRSTVRHMWQKGVQYLRKMGGVILAASVLIWALGYFPRDVNFSRDYTSELQVIESNYLSKLADIPSADQELRQQLEEEKNRRSLEVSLAKETERHRKSYIGKIGHFIEPGLRPLGFDWKMGVSLLSGIAAKEIVVSTMGILYHIGPDQDRNSEPLTAKLREQKSDQYEYNETGLLNPVVALAFMVFILTYFPCIAVIAAIRKEAGSWKWAAFTIFYTTGLAWILAFIINQAGNLIFSNF